MMTARVTSQEPSTPSGDYHQNTLRMALQRDMPEKWPLQSKTLLDLLASNGQGVVNALVVRNEVDQDHAAHWLCWCKGDGGRG